MNELEEVVNKIKEEGEIKQLLLKYLDAYLIIQEGTEFNKIELKMPWIYIQYATNIPAEDAKRRLVEYLLNI